MQIEEVIGANLRQERIQRNMSQPEFGEWIGQALGTAWKPQTVSAAEKGRRQFAAADLVALAHVLDSPVSALLTPPDDVETIQAGAVEIPAAALTRLPEAGTGPVDPALLDWALRGIGTGRRWINEAVEEIRGTLDRIEGATGWQADRTHSIQAALRGELPTLKEVQALEAEELQRAEAHEAGNDADGPSTDLTSAVANALNTQGKAAPDTAGGED